jgi:tetratricopeptide (TPR) repeat protein
MIELLLQAERALSLGMLDQAEGLYRQAVHADPRNSIAVVGLARVALERGDDVGAWRLAQEALVIDPENAAAQRLAGRLEEVHAYRGESLPAMAAAWATGPAVVQELGSPGPGPGSEPAKVPERAPATKPVPTAKPAPAVKSAPEPQPSPKPAAPARRPASQRSVIDRLLRRKHS